MTVTPQMIMKLPQPGYRYVVEYDSDETVDYYPGEEKVPTIAKEVLLNKGIEPLIKS